MRATRARLAGAIAATAAAGSLVAGGAAAGPPAPAGGTGTAFPPAVDSVRAADGNTFLAGSQSGPIAGTLDGTFVLHFSLVIHRDGQFEAHASGVFAVTTPCGAGTAPFEFNATGVVGVVTDGHVTSIRQSENTAGLHVQLGIVGVGGPGPFTYSGSYHCA